MACQSQHSKNTPPSVVCTAHQNNVHMLTYTHAHTLWALGTHTLGTHTCTRQHTQLLKFNTCSTPTCNELKPPSVVPGYLMVQIANYLVISIHTTHSPFILTLIYQLLLERERERERKRESIRNFSKR